MKERPWEAEEARVAEEEKSGERQKEKKKKKYS